MKKIYFYIILVFFLLFLSSFIFNNFCYSKPAQKVIKRPIYHIVRKGECLYTIAKKYGISVRTLKRLNHLRSNIIRPGQRLLVRRIYILPKLNDKFLNSLRESPIFKTHIVQKKENIYTIAKKYRVSPQAIKNFNNLNSYKLRPGQIIKIPIKPPIENNIFYYRTRPIYHIVRKGECLYTIAKNYGISVRTLKRLNHLRSNIIRPGQRLLVRRIPIRVFFKDEKYFNSSDYIIHIVKKGETLYELSLKYHVPIKILKKFNHLTSNLLIPGDRLKIPVNNKSKKQQTIKSNGQLVKKFEINLGEEEQEELKEKFIKVASLYKYFRYKYGGNGYGYLDCSMFVRLVYQRFGIDLPRTAREQFRVGKFVPKDKLLPGDLVFFITRGYYPSHVGIYIGDNKFMHFSSSKKGLTISSLNSKYFRKRYIGAKRVLNNELLKYFKKFLNNSKIKSVENQENNSKTPS